MKGREPGRFLSSLYLKQKLQPLIHFAMQPAGLWYPIESFSIHT